MSVPVHIRTAFQQNPRTSRGRLAAPPAFSSHRRLDSEAGLVTDRAEGTRRIYQIQPQGVQAIHTYLDQMWAQALASFQAVAIRAAASADSTPGERQDQP